MKHSDTVGSGKVAVKAFGFAFSVPDNIHDMIGNCLAMQQNDDLST
jgi:hypothetical protein